MAPKDVDGITLLEQETACRVTGLTRASWRHSSRCALLCNMRQAGWVEVSMRMLGTAAAAACSCSYVALQAVMFCRLTPEGFE